MAIDPNEIGAFINSVGTKEHLVHLKDNINARLLALGHYPGEAGSAPRVEAVSAPVFVEPHAKEVADLAKEIGGELIPHIEAVSLDLDWKSYLRTFLASVVQELVKRALAGAVPAAQVSHAVPEAVFDSHPDMRKPIEAMQAAGMSWVDIWDSFMTYGPAVITLINKIIADWKARQPASTPSASPTPPTAMA